ncbi:phosphatidylethanolamine-binding protein 4 [Echria macrotheca]|uniref:Phosphatidylethanolamine-binding protein 4 n=1 Tax=Echria macrotheca TaxID=438768 RepID=A0AAJ0BBC0_9PEZI|nr:phosphatidylethanolamine-binding protein 4 [Echria macrotheca]
MLLPAGLIALALATIVSADDNAVSVSTLDFKNRFQQSGIVPEVIAALDPSVSFYVSYRAAADGHTELLVPGSSLTIAEAGVPLEFSVENLNNATNITAQTRYLIYLVCCQTQESQSDAQTEQLDADAPARDNPSARNLRHYLAGNYTLSPAMSSVLTTAQRLAVSPQVFFPFTPFTQPNPQPNTGIHRFIYALYVQPARFNTVGFESVGMEQETANWNLSRWRTQLGLGPAIGATFFTIDTTANGGQGVSSNGTSVLTPGAAAGLRASLHTVGLAVVMAVLGFVTLF